MNKGILLILLLLMICCKSVPEKSQIIKNNSIIGITINYKNPYFFFTGRSSIEKIFFLKISNNKKMEIIKSNYSHKNTFYLFNAKPGKYYAVFATDENIKNKYNLDYLIFSNKLNKKSEINVISGSVNYMGSFVIERNISSIDISQIVFDKGLKNIFNNKKYFLFRGLTIKSTYLYPGNIGFTRFKSYEKQKSKFIFLNNLKKIIKGTSWESIIKNHNI